MPKPRDGRRAPERGTGAAAHARDPLSVAADRCIAAHRAVVALDDPDLRRLSELLLVAVGQRLARLDRGAARRLLN